MLLANPIIRRRMAAGAALLVGAGSIALATVAMIASFPHGAVALASGVLAVGAAWYGLLRRGAARAVGLGAAAVLLVAGLVQPVASRRILEDVLILAGLAAALAAARAAFAVHIRLPRARRPERPVLIMNPRSGGGKAATLHLADEARARGIEAVELRPGDDLRQLVRDAIDRGADALAMAGGDGSQAIVASMAADAGLPYACIPAGTRNHFALDLGVDRDDVVGALDALVDGGERRVDLAEVNGRVFVNNVSLGVYAEAVQHEGYRDAKLRTILDTVPDTIGPDGAPLDLRYHDPGGREHTSATVILVSNNRYRLGRLVGSGTRPRIDDGLLGIAVADPSERGALHGPTREWEARSFTVGSAHAVAAGIDGEAALLDAPLTFRMRPRALRVRIAPRHPGASPSAAMPDGFLDGLRELVRIAVGRDAGERPT
jgi:diacylglycerol kinase family enzyme